VGADSPDRRVEQRRGAGKRRGPCRDAALGAGDARAELLSAARHGSRSGSPRALDRRLPEGA
jgi:hypothetical protein